MRTFAQVPATGRRSDCMTTHTEILTGELARIDRTVRNYWSAAELASILDSIERDQSEGTSTIVTVPGSLYASDLRAWVSMNDRPTRTLVTLVRAVTA